MGLTAAQMSVCFQTYWYMWLTNGISGLFSLGVGIGIAAFFLKKFTKPKKAATYRRPPKSAHSITQPIIPTEINTFDDPYGMEGTTGQGIIGTYIPRNVSANSENDPGSLEDNYQFGQSTLQALNGARRRFNSPPLQINEQLSEIAQRWAEHMARNGKLEHSPADWRSYDRQTLGENYTASFQVELTGEKMVKKWLKEGKRYMFGFDGRKDTENFTQLVWQSSQEIGVGRARSEDGNWWYGVVVFNPPGNIPKLYAPNVPLPPE